MDEIWSRLPNDLDMVFLAENMRAGDVAEVAVFSDFTPCQAVEMSVVNSDARFLRSWFAGDKLLCIAGCTPSIMGSAVPWLLGTEALDLHRKRLTREARAGVEAMLAVYERLHNSVDVRQVMTIRWLEGLGFVMGQQWQTVKGWPVVQFERRR